MPIEDTTPIKDNPKEALEGYIKELEADYYGWYESAMIKNFWIWSIAQGVAVVAGLVTAVVAALASEDTFRSFGFLRMILIIFPLIGTFAATFLLQTRVRDLFALRERGRQAIQFVTTTGKARFAAATKKEEFTAIHLEMAAVVEKIESEQNTGFFSVVPDLSAQKTNQPCRGRTIQHDSDDVCSS